MGSIRCRVRCRLLRGGVLLVLCGALATACAERGGTREPAKREILLSSEIDDERVGEEASVDVAAEVGILDDPLLDAYLEEMGRRLLRYAPRRGFEYHFAVVDQFEPNAFALPGGYVFVSRGLVALANTEDELAGVLGHEIVHAASRHASAIQTVGRRQNPFALPIFRMAELAAYGRDQERTADEVGQRIAALAGYDPMGLANFLHRLRDVERLRMGHAQIPGILATHPGTVERAAVCAERARAMRFSRPAGHRDRHLDRIEGIPLGDNPGHGLFDGSRFVHPDLDFQIRFPSGWLVSNAPRAVGAQSPDGVAQVFLSLEGPAGDPHAAAREFVTRHGRDLRLRVHESAAVRIGDVDAWRIDATARIQRRSLEGQLTFVSHAGRMFRISAIAPAGSADRYLARARATARTFAPLDAETRASIPHYRLRVVEAYDGEGVVELGDRTGNALSPTQTAVLNGVFVDHRFAAGDRVKIARAEVYRP